MEKSRSPSLASEITDEKGTEIKSKSPSVAEESVDSKDVVKDVEKSRSPSVTSSTTETKLAVDKSKSPSVAGDVVDMKDVDVKDIEKSRSPSVTSITTETREPSDKSKSPSIIGDAPDLKDVEAKGIEKSRSPSATSVTESKEPLEKSKSPSIAGEAPDDIPVKEKSKSPSLSPSALTEAKDISKSPSVVSDTDSKDIESKTVEKSRSPSITAVITEQKEVADKRPSIAGDLTDLKDIEKSRSPSVTSITAEPKDAAESKSKSPSIAGDTPTDLKDIDKSRSPSVTSVVTETKDKSKSPSVAGDVKDIDAKDIEKSKSPSETSSPTEIKDASVKSKSPDIAEHDADSTSDADLKRSVDISPTSLLDLRISDRRKRSISSDDKKEVSKFPGDGIKDKSVSPVDKTDAIEKPKDMVCTVPSSRDKEDSFVPRKSVSQELGKADERIDDKEDRTLGESVDRLKDERKEDIANKEENITRYILEEYINKGRKITTHVIEEIIRTYSVSEFVVMNIIETIVMTRKIHRDSILEIAEHKRSEDEAKVARGKDATKDTSEGSMSSSLSSELIASDKSTQDSPARSDPHIDEEISISEEKRVEMEKFLEEDYIKQGRRITEEILEEITVRTSLPRYIILEIIEEIILKKKLVRESIIDSEVDYQEDEEGEDSYTKDGFRYEKSPSPRYDERKLSYDYKGSEYPRMQQQGSQMDASISDYTVGQYESQFHKAFVGGVTEIRTTHITTLSGKSTPDMTRDETPDSISEPTASTVEKMEEKSGVVKPSDVSKITTATTITSTVTQRTSTSVVETEGKPGQIILKESKIGEPIETEEESIEQRPEISSDGKVIVVKRIVKREVREDEPDTVQILKESKIGESIRKITEESDVSRLEIKGTEEKLLLGEEESEISPDGKVIIVKKIVKREIVPEDEIGGDDLKTIKEITSKEITIPDTVETVRKETKQIVITGGDALSDGKVSLSDAEKLLTGHKLSDVKVTTTITKIDDTDTSTTDEGTTIKGAVRKQEKEEKRWVEEEGGPKKIGEGGGSEGETAGIPSRARHCLRYRAIRKIHARQKIGGQIVDGDPGGDSDLAR
uniref:Putative microtubule-associated protein futsch n=1 Tax=Apis cerana TaxID=7461 RepID=V9IG86_APICE